MPSITNYPRADFNFEDLESSSLAYTHLLADIAPLLDIPLIERAYRYAWGAHHGQYRKSGAPYIAHPVSASLICATQNMDTTTIMATLLHDVVEDTSITTEDIEAEFGKPVAQLVDGVTKITSIHHDDKQTQQVETYRKMLLTTAQDIRVIIIKFADRIHNLQTLEHMPLQRQIAIAKETLDIYAPLAQRLGMRAIKTELEDLAFKHLYPADYQEVVERTISNRELQHEIVEAFRLPLQMALDEAGIDAEVAGRQKHLYSIFNKYRVRKVPYDEIYDILAMRVICGTRAQCYQILGIIHQLWTPIPEKLKDYIANSKQNGYKSIHTTVSDRRGNIMEIQIRTWDMHYIAEEGVAAHWRYKDHKQSFAELKDSKVVSWLRNLVEWQKEFSDSVEFYEFFKVDIDHSEIMTLTPKKREVYLPMGATVLDFAYAIHSDLGNHCIGAKVNGRVESRGRELAQGDEVNILTDHERSPMPSWLNDVRTPRARSAVKRWLSRTEKEARIALGKQLLQGTFEHLEGTKPLPEYMLDLLQHFALSSEEELYDRIGSAELEVEKVISHLKSIIYPKVNRVTQLMHAITEPHRKPHVVVDGMDDVMVRYATCCHPLPGDEIVGFLTGGRGISVHRKDCSTAKLFATDRDRVVQLSWEYENTKANLIASIIVLAHDRRGLLKDLCTVIDQHNINISEMITKTEHDEVTITIKLHVDTVSTLQHLCEHINHIHSVTRVSREKS